MLMQPKVPNIVRSITTILVLILLVKIAGYFSIVEERAVNQVFKTISRIGMTGLILLVHIRLTRIGCVAAFKYEHILGPLFYCAYLLLGLASFAWSTDPQYSALQWLMTFESFVFVFIFMRVVTLVNHHFPAYRIDLVQVFAWAIFPIMLTFIIGSFVEPDTFYRGMRGGEEKRLGGWIMNPNELGMLSSIGAAMAYLYFQTTNRKLWPFVMMIAAVVILVLTSSRSSAIGFLLIMGILVLMSKNVKLKIAMFGGVVIAVPLLLKYVIFKDAGGVEEVMSMTGRLPFWKALLSEGIVREPFFGFGFMRINYTDYFQGLNTYPAKMTHNTFMQVLMNLGFVGFFIAFWQLVLTIRSSAAEKGSAYSVFSVAMFIPIIINSFTEFGIFGETNYGILFYQFLIFLFFIKIRANLSRKEKLKFKLFQTRWTAALSD
ncbi:MAG: exopolysaccharide production protein ExoQ [Bacteroidia bacterium]|jgi:exopolysaccharide production protein ExoQ